MANILNKLKEAKGKVTIVSEFKDFLKEYKVIGLAVAFVMGVAITTLVTSIVANLIMPIVTFFLPKGTWQTAVWNLGPIAIGWGQILNAIINFIIIAFVVFMMAKFILGEEKVTKK
jgi:large conductance mechanosensitive channel